MYKVHALLYMCIQVTFKIQALHLLNVLCSIMYCTTMFNMHVHVQCKCTCTCTCIHVYTSMFYIQVGSVHAIHVLVHIAGIPVLLFLNRHSNVHGVNPCNN